MRNMNLNLPQLFTHSKCMNKFSSQLFTSSQFSQTVSSVPCAVRRGRPVAVVLVRGTSPQSSSLSLPLPPLADARPPPSHTIKHTRARTRTNIETGMRLTANCLAVMAATSRITFAHHGSTTNLVACRYGERVRNNTCVLCLPGKVNMRRDNANGSDTNCTTITCGVDEYVYSNRCQPCALGMMNEQGDEASGSNTNCAIITCGTDEKVQANTCVSCPAGKTNQAGDEATLRGTECDAITCSDGEKVEGHACVACPVGKSNVEGDDAGGSDTTCDAITCADGEKVEGHACVLCPAGKGSASVDSASGPNTTCNVQLSPSPSEISLSGQLSSPSATTTTPTYSRSMPISYVLDYSLTSPSSATGQSKHTLSSATSLLGHQGMIIRNVFVLLSLLLPLFSSFFP